MTEGRERRTAFRRLPRSSVSHLSRPGGRVDPFDQWSFCPSLVEAFIDMIGEKTASSPCDEALASIVSGLLEGTGCAIVMAPPDPGKPSAIAITGRWESADLAETLQSTGFEWVYALDKAPTLVAQHRGGVRVRAIRRWGRPAATGVAFPVVKCDGGVGAVLITYEARRTFGPTFLAAAKLLTGTLGMQLAIEELGERTRTQAERISRLTSDVERMGILLRRG